jgi:Mn2+/Fe2+ NRAMP family transporter
MKTERRPEKNIGAEHSRSVEAGAGGSARLMASAYIDPSGRAASMSFGDH